LIIDTGLDKRTLFPVSRSFLSPKKHRKKSKFLVNLAPRKLKALNRRVMILNAGKPGRETGIVEPMDGIETEYY